MPTDVRPGIYEHYKGKLYEVIGTARHSETLEIFVVYRKVEDDSSLWVRPFGIFIGEVEMHGTMVPRFRFLKSSVDILRRA